MSLQITVRRGIGEGPTELAAFDAALVAAGVANFNLIALSSVIPPGADVHDVRRPSAHPGTWGDCLYVVMAQHRTSTPGVEVWAGIGWTTTASAGGLFVEHDGTNRRAVEAAIELSLEALRSHRPEVAFGAHASAISGTRCHGRPVCALVVAAFEARGWNAYSVGVR
jgi:arginine decarboxylase